MAEKSYICVDFYASKSTSMDKMETNRSSGYALLDQLIQTEVPFAIYRLPEENEINLILQEKGSDCLRLESIAELDGKAGFVMAPFHITPQTPITIIQPEVMLKGESEVFSYLQEKWTSVSNIFAPTISKEKKKKNYPFFSYAATYARFQLALKTNMLKKLVLSRTVTEERPIDFSAGETFGKALAQYPNLFVYLCHTKETGTWLGCSPELLFSGKRKHGHTVALAGTLLNDGKSRWDQKNLEEQQIVTDYIKTQLDKAGYAFQTYGPYSAPSGNLLHLKTEFSFPLAGNTAVGSLLQALHPTPAVCGLPKEKAFNFILKHEKVDRRYYSGFTGCLQQGDRTELFVNLRCARIDSDSIHFYAGGGILPSSRLQTEWEETEEKLQTIRSLLKREKAE